MFGIAISVMHCHRENFRELNIENTVVERISAGEIL